MENNRGRLIIVFLLWKRIGDVSCFSVDLIIGRHETNWNIKTANRGMCQSFDLEFSADEDMYRSRLFEKFRDSSRTIARRDKKRNNSSSQTPQDCRAVGDCI